MRTVVAPIKEATFGETPRLTRWSRYSPSVVQVTGYLMSPCASATFFFITAFSGPGDSPSPKISSVTPCRMSLCERPSAINDSVAQLSMLMNPGATARPVASISARPRALSNLPMAVMLSPSIARSATTGALPLPS